MSTGLYICVDDTPGSERYREATQEEVDAAATMQLRPGALAVLEAAADPRLFIDYGMIGDGRNNSAPMLRAVLAYRGGTAPTGTYEPTVIHPTARAVLEAVRGVALDGPIMEAWRDAGFPISAPETAALRELSMQRDALLGEVEKRRAPETIRARLVEMRMTPDYAEVVMSLSRSDAQRLAALWDLDVDVVVPHE